MWVSNKQKKIAETHFIRNLNFVKSIPKIGIRFLAILFFGKKFAVKSFNIDSICCIDGGLNQLWWEVENALFLTLSNSNRIFFDSGELIFKVSRLETSLDLVAYGINSKKKITVKMKVIVLDKMDLANITSNPKLISVVNNKSLHKSSISINLIEKMPTSLRPSLKSDKVFERKINFPKSQFLDKSLTVLHQIESLEKVQKLKHLIIKNPTKISINEKRIL